jgi:hypothetical protein
MEQFGTLWNSFEGCSGKGEANAAYFRILPHGSEQFRAIRIYNCK